MAYQFQNPQLNPRPELSDSWGEITYDELMGSAPAAARGFLSAMANALPEVVEGLVLLRHPDDRDDYAIYQSDRCALAIQFDVDLDYICIWPLVGPASSAEHGDWGDGIDAQVQGAVEHVRSILESR